MFCQRPPVFPGPLPPIIGGVLGTGLPWESGGGGAPWSPAALGSKVTLLLDQRDLVSSGGAYTDWGDQSPGGTIDFTQGTAANRPSTGRSINGWEAPDFDGTNDRMTSAALQSSLWSTTAFELYAVCDIDAIPAGSGNMYDRGAIVTGANGGSGVTLQGGGLKAFGYDGAYRTAAVALTTGRHLLHARHDGVNITARVDADAETSAALGTQTGGFNTALVIGANYNQTAFLDMGMSFLLCTNAALTTAERTSLRTYLAAKYGVTA